MILKTRVSIYLGVVLATGLVIGTLIGHFLLIPQQVVVSGTVSDNTTYRPLFVMFVRANGGSECNPLPYSASCDRIANATAHGTYSMSIPNNEAYEVSVGYGALNSTSNLISFMTANLCSAGYLFVDSLSSASYNATCSSTLG